MNFQLWHCRSFFGLRTSHTAPANFDSAEFPEYLRFLANVLLFGDFARFERELQFQQAPLTGRAIRILLFSDLLKRAQDELDTQNGQAQQIVDQKHKTLRQMSGRRDALQLQPDIHKIIRRPRPGVFEL